RLVERRAPARAVRPVPGLRRGAALVAAGPAGAVRRLRRLAAGLAAGGGAGVAARLVAPAAGRRPGGPRAARGPAAPAGAESPRRPAGLRAAPGVVCGAPGARARRGGDPVHGAARRLPGAARP